MAGGYRQRHAPVTALLVLSLLWAGGTMRLDLQPGSAAEAFPPLLRQAVSLALLAALASSLALWRGLHMPRRSQVQAGVGCGFLLFVIPTLLNLAARETVPSLTRAALFALTPVFAVVIEPYLGRERAEPVPGRALPAALAAAAGAFCLLPVAVPESLAATAGFCGLIAAAFCMAAANCWATLATDDSLPAFAAISAFSASIVLAIASVLLERPQGTALHGVQSAVGVDLCWLLVVDLPSLALFYWLLPRMPASQMTTRYLWALIFPVVLGAAFLRVSLAWRSWVGLTLLSIGATLLLLPSRQRPRPSSGLIL